MQRLAFTVISWLPFPLIYACAWLAYLLIYHVVRYRRDVVKENLRQSFPEKSDAELKSQTQNLLYWARSSTAA
jgi:KDO2-lipid IV(A) lauroyltransferase